MLLLCKEKESIKRDFTKSPVKLWRSRTKIAACWIVHYGLYVWSCVCSPLKPQRVQTSADRVRTCHLGFFCGHSEYAKVLSLWDTHGLGGVALLFSFVPNMQSIRWALSRPALSTSFSRDHRIWLREVRHFCVFGDNLLMTFLKHLFCPSGGRKGRAPEFRNVVA